MSWRPALSLPVNPWPYIRPYSPDEVTSINTAGETDPRDVGLSHEDVSAIWGSVLRLYATRLHPAIGLCIRHRGKVIVERAIGHARGNAPGDGPEVPKVPATYGTLFNIYSASKAVTAMLIHLLDERGLIRLDDPVAEYLPAFAQNGKDRITIRHVLTHRSGIPSVSPDHVDLAHLADRKRVVERICEMKPISLPGRRIAYHAITGGYVLAAVLEAVTGKDIQAFLRSEVLGPLGFSRMQYGVPAEDLDKVAVAAFTGPPALPPYSWILERALGVSIRRAAEISNDPRFLTAVVPSGNIVASINESGRFFELLLRGGELDGVRVFDPRTVRRATAEQSFLEFDYVLVMPMRYGMGFMLGSKWASLYGHDTQHAFGHLGFTSIVVYADVERDISVSLMTSGKPFVTIGQLPWLNIARTIARRIPRTLSK